MARTKQLHDISGWRDCGTLDLSHTQLAELQNELTTVENVLVINSYHATQKSFSNICTEEIKSTCLHNTLRVNIFITVKL